MNVQLPISIKLNNDLVRQFKKLPSLANKLEAQYNFQTMTSGWYGDEDNIIDIILSLENYVSFAEQVEQSISIERVDYADDVVSFFDKKINVLHCFVALTENEIVLLAQHEKLISGFLDKKLSKVLNLIALELGVSSI